MLSDFYIVDGVLKKYNGRDAHVIIPTDVKEIGFTAFEGCGSLTVIELPDGVERIGERAFDGCTRLHSVTIPDSVTEIGYAAFCECSSLTSVTISNNVTALPDNVFRGCTSLTTVFIPESVTEIRNTIFERSAKVTVVCREGSCAHRFCTFNRIACIFDYQYKAFNGLIPQGFAMLASPFLADEEKPYIFISYSHKDRDAVLPIIKDLYEAGWKIWYDEGLTIGDSYDQTLESHVKNCSAFLLFVTENSLDSLYVKENEIPWAIESRKPIIKCILDEEVDYEIKGAFVLATVKPSQIEPALEQVDGLKKGEPREAKGISVAVDTMERGENDGCAYCVYAEENAATARAVLLEAKSSGCNLYDAVEAGEDEESLQNAACLIVFLDKAFLSDQQLTKLLVDAYAAGRDIAVCQLEDIGDTDLPRELLGLHKMQWLNFVHGVTADMNTKLARHLQKRGCRNTAVLPGFDYETTGGDIVIKRYTGMDPSPRIESSYGDKPVTKIYMGAFTKCVRLKTLVIPDGVTEIGRSAFEGCSNLTYVSIPDSVRTIGENAFKDCASLKTVVIPEGVTRINKKTFDHCSALESVVIPNSVTNIEDNAFSWCKSLRSIALPNGLTSLGRGAFQGCVRLTDVALPNGVKLIGFSHFDSCAGLLSVALPDDLTFIGSGMFQDCVKLREVAIPHSVTRIGDRAFGRCHSLTSVNIPDSVTEIGKRAFRSCTSLTALSIPASVTRIGEEAFKDCPELTVSCQRGSCAWKYCKRSKIPVNSSGFGLFGKK